MMKKYYVLLGCLLITFQVSLLFIYQSEEFQVKNTTRITNLTTLMIPFEYSNQTAMILCSENAFREQYKQELHQLQYFHTNQLYEMSTDVLAMPKLPYFYSLWRTSSLLPRLMSPCEHQTYIKLLKIFNEICQENDIEYMISHGTLLGSYRNHDILPYDDDVDILIHAKYYSRLSQLNKSTNEKEWEFHLRSSSNMKFYFLTSPSAGIYPWKWPFIGIQFYTDNITHIHLDEYIRKDLIFPLILRPIATLWLPAPRYVHRYLNSLRKRYFVDLSIDEKCMTKDYSHRNEKQLNKSTTINCSQLYNDYPYIRRVCDENDCYEYLRVHGTITLYILKISKDRD